MIRGAVVVLLLALLLALSMVMSADAAPVRLYTPGGSPCAGACTYDWAVKQFDVPEGVPERMMIPAGSYILNMSYAKAGVPLTSKSAAILAEDESGIGYYFKTESGETRMMVRIDKCLNWSVMIPPEGTVPYFGTFGSSAGVPFKMVSLPPTGTTPWGPGSPDGPWTPLVPLAPIFPPYVPPVVNPPCCGPVVPPPVVVPPVVAPVPVPASLGLLVVALGSLLLFRGRAYL